MWLIDQLYIVRTGPTTIFSDFKGQDLTLELDRLRKEKIDSIFELEKYKKRISLAIVFAIVGFAVAITMIIWRFRYHP